MRATDLFITRPPPTSLTADHSDSLTWERLISASHTLTKNERISLITKIFLDRDQVEVVVANLSGDDAQTFIDVVDEVFHTVSPLKHEGIDSHSQLLHPVG